MLLHGLGFVVEVVGQKRPRVAREIGHPLRARLERLDDPQEPVVQDAALAQVGAPEPLAFEVGLDHRHDPRRRQVVDVLAVEPFELLLVEHRPLAVDRLQAEDARHLCLRHLLAALSG